MLNPFLLYMNAPHSPAASSLPIVIIGAGLTGSLLAIFLARRGYLVEVYEKRPDPRRHQAEEGRSINLALSHRGLKALQKMGLVEAVLQKAIPMRGRLVHSQEGDLTYMPYGKDQTEFINSISRIGLNQILLEQAENYPGIRFHFEARCHQVFLREGYIEILDTSTQEIKKVVGRCFFAADGAGSVVRQALAQQWPGYQSISEFLPHGYKELTFPPEAAGAFAMEPNALHIWPRGSFMLIALPNYDGSFTGTLFLAKEGPVSFDALPTPEAVTRFSKPISRMPSP
ncbi:MAG: FAD-dependent monooxygenase [Microscillaceae bacterium]|nr:FAD-dependent monooxygenase [Microscillaceae bacterium]